MTQTHIIFSVIFASVVAFISIWKLETTGYKKLAFLSFVFLIFFTFYMIFLWLWLEN